jgi:hypothetical protein
VPGRLTKTMMETTAGTLTTEPIVMTAPPLTTAVIPHSEIAETKPPYVCPGYFIYTYSNNMINRCHVQ